MIVHLSNKDVHITLLKIKLLKDQFEGPGTPEVNELEKKIDALMSQNATLQQKLIKYNDEAIARLTLIIRSLSRQPPSL